MVERRAEVGVGASDVVGKVAAKLPADLASLVVRDNLVVDFVYPSKVVDVVANALAVLEDRGCAVDLLVAVFALFIKSMFVAQVGDKCCVA